MTDVDPGASSEHPERAHPGPSYGPVERYRSGFEATDPGAGVTPAAPPSPTGPGSLPDVAVAATYSPVPQHPSGGHGPDAYPARAPAPSGPPTPPPYGQATPPYGYPPATYTRPPLRTDYAPWGRRVAALVIDNLLRYVGLALFGTGYVMWLRGFTRGEFSPTSTAVATAGAGGVVLLAALVWDIYNRWFVAGRTGQSLGRRAMRIWLVGRQSNAPIGPLNAFVRDLLHFLDGASYVGYLWPLWDPERQTFADKIAETVVVTTPVSPLPSARAS